MGPERSPFMSIATFTVSPPIDVILVNPDPSLNNGGRCRFHRVWKANRHVRLDRAFNIQRSTLFALWAWDSDPLFHRLYSIGVTELRCLHLGPVGL